MPIDNTAELKKLIKKHKWSVDDLCEMLPVQGKPRSYRTAYGWVTDSQHRVIPDDCLTILRLRVELEKLKKK